MQLRSIATRASQAPRDETDGLASIPCSRTPGGGNSMSYGLGDRPSGPLAERLTRHDPAPRSLRRGLVSRSAGDRHDDADGQARVPANRRLCRVRADDDSPTHQSRAQACGGAGREARPTEDRRRDRTEGSKAAREGCGYFEGGQVARHRDWHGAAHLRRASDESARGGAMSKGERPQALGQSLQESFATRWAPYRGDFCFGDFTHAPSPKNLSKNGFCPPKGGSLSDGNRF